MSGTEHHADALVFSNHCAGQLQGLEKLPRQIQSRDDVRIVFSGFCADHAAGGGVGVFVALDAAEPIHQVFGDHQKVRCPLKLPGEIVSIQLVNRVEGLELNSGAAIQLRKGHFLMHLFNNRFRAPVPIGVAGQDGLIMFHQHVIHSPGIDGQTFDLRTQLQRLIDARPHVCFQDFYVPG